MKDKLTLRLDREAIARAKAHAAATGTSVSALVARFFAALPEGEPTAADSWRDGLPPITSSLVGLAEGADVDEDDYRQHLLDKHAG